jgi:hypothetical protein
MPRVKAHTFAAVLGVTTNQRALGDAIQQVSRTQANVTHVYMYTLK